MGLEDVDDAIQLLSDGISIGKEEMQALRWLRARVEELEADRTPKSIADAPTNGICARVWVQTSDGSAAWFDARYIDDVWRESRIEHLNHGFVEKPGKVLRPSLFLPFTPLPDQRKEAD